MIHIFYDFQDGPWGGGNQFLKALRENFRQKGVYSEDIKSADIVLVNSHHFGDVNRLKSLLQNLSGKTIIHRLDGPVALIRDRNEGSDNIIFRFNKLFAKGSVIQSHWCMEHCVKLGLEMHNPYEIILNAPNPDNFFPAEKRESEKIRLVATSWSSNTRKGFKVYQWMDDNLDWQKYEMTFIGNSPITFKNIKHMPPLDSKQLGDVLRKNDIYVTASQTDPCSNSLIEALHSGLPALVLRDGGHPEIVGKAGLCFDKVEEIPTLLREISVNINDFRSKITLPSIDIVANEYYNFLTQCHKTASQTSVEKSEIDNFIRLFSQYAERNAPKSFYKRAIQKVLKLLK